MIGSEIDVAAYKIDIGSGIDRKGKSSQCCIQISLFESCGSRFYIVGKDGNVKKYNEHYGTYTAEYCRSTGLPMYQKSDYEKRKNLYSCTQRKRMGKPVIDNEQPVAFYRVLNGYVGLYESK